MDSQPNRPDAREVASLRWALEPSTDPWVMLAVLQRRLELHGALFADDWIEAKRQATATRPTVQ